MSVYLYDKALIDAMQEITGDSRIKIVSPDLAIQYLAQVSKDKVNFPAIVLSRGPVRLNDYRNQVAALKGQSAKVDDDNKIVKARLIPMRIEWTIDVFAVDRFTCDEIIRELVFFFTSYPRFNVRVPYDLDIDQNFDVLMSPEIEDNSDLIEFTNRGEYFRETLTVYTENAHMFSSYEMYPTKVGATLEIDATLPSDIEKIN